MIVQQELRWHEKRNRWAVPGRALFNPKKYYVQEIPQKQGAAFVSKHHYLASWPTSRAVAGLFEMACVENGLKDSLVGVCNFGVCSNSSAPGFWVAGNQQNTVELNRLILLDQVPFNAESWFIARAISILNRKHPQVTSILSYADPYPWQRLDEDGQLVAFKSGHIGTVYAASNFVYMGLSSKQSRLISNMTGTNINLRMLQKLKQGVEYAYRSVREQGASPKTSFESWPQYHDRIKEEMLLTGRWERIKHFGNHTYALPVGEKSYRKATLSGFRPSFSYPKI